MLKILAPWSWFQHKKNNWYFFLKGGYFYWEFDIKYLENFHESQSTFVFSDVLINYILTFQPQAYSFFMFLLFFLLETGSHYILLHGLELAVKTNRTWIHRDISASSSECGDKGMHYHGKL